MKNARPSFLEASVSQVHDRASAVLNDAHDDAAQEVLPVSYTHLTLPTSDLV